MVDQDDEIDSGFGLPRYKSMPPYRMITTFNAQITKWGFWACGFVIGFLFALLIK